MQYYGSDSGTIVLIEWLEISLFQSVDEEDVREWSMSSTKASAYAPIILIQLDPSTYRKASLPQLANTDPLILTNLSISRHYLSGTRDSGWRPGGYKFIFLIVLVWVFIACTSTRKCIYKSYSVLVYKAIRIRSPQYNWERSNIYAKLESIRNNQYAQLQLVGIMNPSKPHFFFSNNK